MCFIFHINRYHGLTPARSSAPHSCSLSSLVGQGENQKGKRKFLCWNKDSFNGSNKSFTRAKHKTAFITHFLWSGRCSSIPRKAGLHVKWWLDKTNTIAPNLTPPNSSSPSSTCWAWCHVAWDISWLGSAVPTVSPPCAPRALSLVGWGEEQQRLWLCVITAQQKILNYQHSSQHKPKT